MLGLETSMKRTLPPILNGLMDHERWDARALEKAMAKRLAEQKAKLAQEKEDTKARLQEHGCPILVKRTK